MTNSTIEQIPGAVLISRLSSLPVALWLRDRLKQVGFNTSINVVPGAPGYQISVYVRSLEEVKEALRSMGVNIKDA